MNSGRIPQSFLDDVLGRVDIVDVVGSRVKLKKSGKNYMGLCPFHHEKSPSFSVNSDKQFYHCFGCGAGGDAIQFLIEYERLDFTAAVEELARFVGMEVPREESPQQREQHKLQSQLYQVLKRASELYYQNLKAHEQRHQAVNYLKTRGLSGQIAKHFQIGFAPEGWQNLKDQLLKENHSNEQLLLAGLTVESEQGTQYDRFRNRIIFPIRDARGRTIGFGGRVLNNDKPKYLNSPETPVFHKGQELYGLYEAKQIKGKLERILIVEGYMDVVALSQHGIHYAVATLGTSTSDTHLQRLFKLVDDVTFCFDGDAAGRNAAWRALEIAINHLQDGRQIRFLFLPDGEDPDSLVRKEGPEQFALRIREATPLIDFLFNKIKENININTLDGKASYAKQLLGWLDQLPGKSLIRALATTRLADITGLAEETLKSLTATQPEQTAETLEEAEQPQQAPTFTPEKKTHNDFFGENYKPKQSALNQAQKLIANLIRQPQLAKNLTLPEDFQNTTDVDTQLLLQVIKLLNQAPAEHLINPFLTCDWLHSQGLDKILRHIENSDYFWLVKYKKPEEQANWEESELQKNLQDLQEKLPDKEYLHLKNRITHHSSEVTEEERNRYKELLVQRKR
ncbi:DNA primase [Gynuella sp.]|uniref:DNA primase n=1 Tax=Gynuella sp. TaxID=2969146 RepID=UPI003D12DF9F